MTFICITASPNQRIVRLGTMTFFHSLTCRNRFEDIRDILLIVSILVFLEGNMHKKTKVATKHKSITK